MLAFLVLILAVLSRFLPHSMHAVGINFTAVGAGLLFFGSRRPRWQAAIAAALMAVADILLTKYVYGYPFHTIEYLFTWAWYAAACLIGSGLLRRITALRVVAGVFASATSFFLLSNFSVWAFSGLYPRNAAGLMTSYVSGLPFYGNDLISTGLFSALLFGVPVLATQIVEATQQARHSSQPL